MVSLLDPELLKIMVCPRCRCPLREKSQSSQLQCQENPDHLYPVYDGVPDMRIEESE